MKKCTNCGVEKELSEFHKSNIRVKCKYNSICKICANNKSYEWRSKNKDKISAANTRYYKNHPEKRRYYLDQSNENNRTKVEQTLIRQAKKEPNLEI